jgi:hypothetical protein
MSQKNKRRLALECPCCGGEVTHRNYAFTVIRPPRITRWLVCDACARALDGDDPAARHKAELAFMDYLEGLADAHAA